MQKTLTKFVVICFAVLCVAPVWAGRTPGARVKVIAPSSSTFVQARQIMGRVGWVETATESAQAILVVVRSMNETPLWHQYGSLDELEHAAGLQLNSNGETFHVYLYAFDQDNQVKVVSHQSYAVN